MFNLSAAVVFVVIILFFRLCKAAAYGNPPDEKTAPAFRAEVEKLERR